MVDIQTVSIMVTATSVTIAATYYIMTLRETNKNRKLTFTHQMIQSLLSEEGARRYGNMMSMSWENWDDFKHKYDRTRSVENFQERWSFWSTCEALGYQYRIGLIDLDTLYILCRRQIINGWIKFKPVIDQYKKDGDYSTDSFQDWEFLARKLNSIQKLRDPNWRGSGFTTLEEYDKAFS